MQFIRCRRNESYRTFPFPVCFLLRRSTMRYCGSFMRLGWKSRVCSRACRPRGACCTGASIGLRFMHYFLGECVTRRGIPFIFTFNGWDREIRPKESTRGTSAIDSLRPCLSLLVDHGFLCDYRKFHGAKCARCVRRNSKNI